MKMSTDFTVASQFATKIADDYSQELQRVKAKGYPMPSLNLVKIPYDLIELGDADAQIRVVNVNENKDLTNQIRAQGVISPPVLQPLRETGKFVPVSGHTRIKSCIAIKKDVFNEAKKYDFHDGVWAFVYDEVLSDPNFEKIAFTLNDHPVAVTNSPADVQKLIEKMISAGRLKPVIELIIDAIEDIGVTFSFRQIKGIAEKVINNRAKNSLSSYIQGAIQLYGKTRKDLFNRFGVVTTASTQTSYNSAEKTISCARGLNMNDSWTNMLTEHFNSLMDDVRDYGGGNIVNQRDLYLHIIQFDNNAADNGESPEEMLNNARQQILKEAVWRSDACNAKLSPTRIIFFPQLQRATDRRGDPIMGEEIKDLVWSLSQDEDGNFKATKI